MAFTGEVAALLYRSAVSIIRSLPSVPGEAVLARRIIRTNGRLGNQAFAAFQAIARAAIRGWRAGQQVDQSGPSVVGIGSLPRDPSIEAGQPRAKYRILVTVTDTQSGQEYRYATDLLSDVALSMADIVQQVSDNFAPWASQRADRRALGQLGARAAVSVRVLSAGRR